MKVFETIEGVVYCFIDALIDAGIAYRAIEDGYRRQSAHWQSITDPNDNRRRLIAFEPLKEKYKAQVIAKYGNPTDWLNRQAIDKRLTVIERMDRTLPIETRHYNYYQKYHPKTKAYSYAKVTTWLEVILELKGSDCRGYGFEGKTEFLVQLADYLKDKDLPVSLGSLQMIQRQCRIYGTAKLQSEQAALDSMLDGRKGNQNALKIGEEQAEYIIALMASSSKPPATTVTMLYNRKAGEMGWKRIDKRTVEYFVQKPDVIAQYFLLRNGKKAAYNDLEIATLRDKPSAPGMLWVMDGTPIDLYYREQVRKYNPDKQDWEWSESKWNRLNLFMIIDAFSWKIIGYYISERENHVAVIEALRNAVRNGMETPLQLMYDQSAANKYVRSILEELAKYNTANRPYKSRGKVIEPFIGHFQQEQIRYHDNWGGQNITAKKLESRANPDALAEALKKLPTKDELIKWIDLHIELWNERATEEREKPNYLHTTQKTKAKTVDWTTFCNLFFVVTEKEYKYQNEGGIGIQILKEQYNFQTWDMDLHLNVLVNQKFQVAYDPDTMEFVYLYKNGKPVLDKKGEPVLIPRLEKLPMAIGDYKDEKGSRVREYVKAQNEGVEMLEAFAKKTKTSIESLEVALSPQFVHKHAYNRAEENLKRKQAVDEGNGGDWEDLFDNPYKV